jgi:hypothetical protein
MPLNFKPASQNGAVPPTPAKYKQSKLGLIASTTTSVLGQPIVVKALSDAAYYKTTPVTLYAFNPSTNQTIATTSSFIDTVQAPFVLSNLPDGQWQLWAEWPGDGPFVAKSTKANLINLTVNTAVNTGGRLTLIPSPASGSLVAGEGTATFFATITNVTSFLGGSLLFYDGNQQIGSVVLNQNHASFSTDQLTAGTHNITVQWPGGLIGGTRYQGFSTSTNYALSSATVSGTTLNLTVSPNHGVFQEGYITLTASLTNGAANYPGSVVFYRNGVELYTAPVLGTTATYTYRNFEAVGPTEFKALWDGNSTGHPRFVPVASSTVSWTVAARETPSRLSVAVVPNPTAFSAPTYFTATFHQLAGEPLVQGEVVFYADDIVVGRAPIINDVATTSNRYVMTGTHAVYAYYAGSANEPKFYSTRSETVSLLVKEGLNIGAPLTLTVTNDYYKGTTTPYVKGETQKFTANITTSRQMTGLAYFAINGVENFSAPWINNSATTTFVFDNSGTYNVQAIWHGGDIGGNFYASTSSVITNIAVLDGYTLTQPITLSPSLTRVINEPLTITAAVTTSSGMRGTMTFYANALALGTAQWNSATNQAVLTTTAPVSSGTYTISALWSGGYIDDSRLYVGKTANTSTIFVDAAQRITSLKLNANIPTLNQTIMTATVVAGTTFNNSTRGQVTFSQSGNVLGTSTFVNDKATLSVAQRVSISSANPLMASYGGTNIIPKYYPFSTSTNGTGVSINLSKSTFRYYNPDSTTNTYATATITLSNDDVGHLPTGTITLIENYTNTVVGTVSLNGSTSAVISWKPLDYNQLDLGYTSVSAVYSGDVYNATGSVGAGIAFFRKAQIPQFIVTRKNGVGGSPTPLYYSNLSRDYNGNFITPAEKLYDQFTVNIGSLTNYNSIISYHDSYSSVSGNTLAPSGLVTVPPYNYTTSSYKDPSNIQSPKNILAYVHNLRFEFPENDYFESASLDYSFVKEPVYNIFWVYSSSANTLRLTGWENIPSELLPPRSIFHGGYTSYLWHVTYYNSVGTVLRDDNFDLSTVYSIDWPNTAHHLIAQIINNGSAPYNPNISPTVRITKPNTNTSVTPSSESPSNPYIAGV